jgi:hypothetical protein
MTSSYPNIQTRVSFTHGTKGNGGTVALDANGQKAYLYDTTSQNLDNKHKLATLYYRGTQQELCISLNSREEAPNFKDNNGQDWSDKTMSDMIRHGLSLLDYKQKRRPIIYINDAPDETIKLVHHAVTNILTASSKKTFNPHIS